MTADSTISAVTGDAVTEVVSQKTYYLMDVMTVGASTFSFYNGKTVVQDADAEAPTNAVEWQPPPPIANAVHFQYGGAWVPGINPKTATVSTLQGLAAMAAQESFESAVSALTGPYSAAEQKSWATQVADAQAVLAAGTPSALLMTLATARGLDVKALAQKIVDKDAAYQTAYAQALATYQVSRDQVATTTTTADLLGRLEVLHLIRAYAATLRG